MMNRRGLLVAVAAGAASAPLRLFAQQSGKLWRIGYLEYGTRRFAEGSRRYAAFIDGLRALGRVESRDFVIEARFADGESERLAALAAELVAAKVDVVLSGGTPTTYALLRETKTIPIVITTVADPVAEGFAASLSRPGKNITGLSGNNAEIIQKQLELMVKGLPRLQRIAVLSNPANQGHPQQLGLVRDAARRAGLSVVAAAAHTPEEIEKAFASMTRERAEAVIILGDNLLVQQGSQIARLAREHRMASILTPPDYAEAGGLMSYGPDIREQYRRAAGFVDKIMKGAKPGELPFEQPTLYYLVINRRTAKAIGVTIPQELLLRADRVIE